MFTLPTKPIKAEEEVPRRMVIVGHTKTGKTDNTSELPNSLLIDLEDGSEFTDATKINLRKEVDKYNLSTDNKITYLEGLIFSSLAA